MRAGSFVAAGMLALAATPALAQYDLPQIAPTAEPPVSPTTPGQAPQAFGYPLERQQSVADRPRPDYDPLGIRVGGFFFYPKAEVGELYNSNVFATNTAKKDDFITLVTPKLDLLSNWGRHELDFSAGATVGTYANNTSENFGDYYFSTQGRFDISHQYSALGGARYEHLHEERDAPTFPGDAAHPVEFDVYSGNLGFESHGLRFGYLASFDFRREDYSNVNAIGGGTINEQVRNVNIYSPAVRINYEFSPGYSIYTRFSGNIRDYDNSTAGSSTIPNRDSAGYRADIGALIDLTGVTYAQVYGGYFRQNYRSPAFSSIGGPDVGARVIWNPTQLTSVSLNVERSVQDENNFATTFAGTPAASSPGYLETTASIRIDHELLRNLLLNAEVRYENDDFKGIDATNDRYDVTLGARYLFSRNLYFGGSFTYTKRDASGTQSFGQFDRELVLFRIGTQL
jgi:hypothetical protein